MTGLRVSAAAERDLDDIWHYVATNSGSFERANKFVDAITQRLSILAHSPKAGTLRSEIDRDIRGLPVEDYIVYYREYKPPDRHLPNHSREPRSGCCLLDI